MSSTLDLQITARLFWNGTEIGEVWRDGVRLWEKPGGGTPAAPDTIHVGGVVTNRAPSAAQVFTVPLSAPILSEGRAVVGIAGRGSGWGSAPDFGNLHLIARDASGAAIGPPIYPVRQDRADAGYSSAEIYTVDGAATPAGAATVDVVVDVSSKDGSPDVFVELFDLVGLSSLSVEVDDLETSTGSTGPTSYPLSTTFSDPLFVAVQSNRRQEGVVFTASDVEMTLEAGGYSAAHGRGADLVAQLVTGEESYRRISALALFIDTA